MKSQIDSSILAAALLGYQNQLEHVKQRIEEIRRRLGGRTALTLSGVGPERKSRISAAGRARIAAAQRKRWAEARKAKPAA